MVAIETTEVTDLTNPDFFKKHIDYGFRHIFAYYLLKSNCKGVSLLQFSKFIIKC